MESDPGLNLETDRLEQLLEDPPPPQSVVVVEYRSRGVPIWIFFTLIVLVPLGALVVYDRTVTARTRAEASQTRQSLEDLAAKSTTPTKSSAANPTPGGVLFMVESGNSETNPASLVTGQATPSTALPAASPASALNAGQGSGLATAGSASVPPATAALGPRLPLSDSATDPQAIQRPTMRSILPNPFADGAKPPQPPAPGEGPASRPAGTGEHPSAVTGQSEPGPRPPAQEQAHNDSPPVNEPASRDDRLALQPPLPSKEESERQLREEALKKQADRFAQVENRVALQRSQRIIDQTKFHDELREAIRSHKNLAGPEIDKIAKRYDGEIDHARWNQALQAWKFSRLSQSAKVKYVRDLDLPDAVILEFLCADIHTQINKRNGPRNENEVRVRAATLLLKLYPVAAVDPSPTANEPAQARTPGNGAGRP
jgi:hypothetical protein